MAVGQNPVSLVNIKIGGKWMFIHPNFPKLACTSHTNQNQRTKIWVDNFNHLVLATHVILVWVRGLRIPEFDGPRSEAVDASARGLHSALAAGQGRRSHLRPGGHVRGGGP